MKKYCSQSFWISCILLLMATVGCHSNALKVKVFKEGSTKPINTFKTEIADDPQERSLGLMYRKELGPDEGMFFIFTAVTEGPFWMKNTLIPLDIIFISEDKKINTIVANAEPQTTTPREPLEGYRYVLEIPGGRAQQLGIQVGDRVEF